MNCIGNSHVAVQQNAHSNRAALYMPARRRRPGTIIGDAWEEYLVSKQTATGNGELYMPQLADVPGWFPAMELGMSIDHGPSIHSNVRTLKVDNVKRREDHRYLEARDAEHNRVIVSAKRMSPDESRKALRAKLREVGISVRDGQYRRVAVG